MDLVHNGGGGFGPSPLFTYFFYFYNVKKICLNIENER